MKKLLVCLCLAVISLSAQRFQPYIEGNGRFFDFLRGGGATLWIPAAQDDNQLLFAQVHGGYYRKFLTKWSIGGGYRRLYSKCHGLGVNAFLDAARSDAGHRFLQGGVGLEAFSPCWVARINGYFPRRRSIPIDNQAALVGTRVVPNNLRQVTYTGLDLEFGYGIPVCYGEFWTYAGYYYYSARQVPSIQGPKIRAEYNLYGGGVAGPQLTIGGEYRYDQVHHSEGALIMRLRLPLYMRNWKPCRGTPRIKRRMGAPVRRELNIWVENTRVLEQNNTLANLFFASATGTVSAGTQANPTTLADAVARAGIGDILFLLSDDGTITGPVTLQQSQQLQGFGDGISTTLTVGGQMLTIDKLNPAGVRPIMTAGTGIVPNTGNTIQGIALSGGTRYLNGTNTGGLLIDNITATGAVNGGSEVFLITGASSPTIINSTFSTGGLTLQLIEFMSLTGNVTVANNNLINISAPPAAGFTAVTIRDVAGEILIDNNAFNIPENILSANSVSILQVTPVDSTTVVSNNSFAAGGENFHVIGTIASSGRHTVILDNNNFTNYDQQSVQMNHAGTNTLDFIVRNNQFVATPSSDFPALRMNDSGSGATNFTVQNNVFANHTGGTATGIVLARSSLLTSTVTALIEFNTGTNMRQLFLTDPTVSTAGLDFITLRNNSVTASGTPNVAYNFASQVAGSTASNCYTIENNSSTGFLSAMNVGAPDATGTVSSFPSNTSGGLLTANPGITGAIVVVGGVTESPGPCPLP